MSQGGEILITTTVFPGRYVQGPGALRLLGREAARFGKKCFCLASPTVYTRILPGLRDVIGPNLEISAEKFAGECSYENIDHFRKLALNTDCDVVIGLGGGKTLDTAKGVAFNLQKPVIIVPTVASTDAPCSAIAVMHTPTGEMIGPLFLDRSPAAVLVDSRIIAQAPSRFLVAGMGDALAKRFEAESCRKKSAPNMTNTGDVASFTAFSLAGICYQTLLTHGAAARKDCEAHCVTPDLENIIEANTLLSSAAFENNGLAAAHAIEIGFSFLSETHNFLHGEIVSFSTLASLFLTEKDAALINEVYSFCESVDLPTTLSRIGLGTVSNAGLEQMVEKVCAAGGLIYNEPLAISEEAVLAAIKAADTEGRRRISKRNPHLKTPPEN